MKNLSVLLLLLLLTACSKPTAPSASSTASPAKSLDPVQQKLLAYSGPAATDCGRLDVHATADQSKAASACALQASQAKQAFYVAYDMPGMSVGVAGNSDGKLFTVQTQGSGALSSGDCSSQLRVASSGRVTCFAPGDMGSMAGSHSAGAMPQGARNPTPISKAANRKTHPRENCHAKTTMHTKLCLGSDDIRQRSGPHPCSPESSPRPADQSR